MDDEFLLNIGVTTELLTHLRTEDPNHPFGYRCRKPWNWQFSPMAECEVSPLWECGTVVSYFNVKTGHFEQCSLENIDDVWGKYTSLQGLLAELFIDVYEDELEASLMIKYADLFGFHSVHRLLIEIDSAPEDYGQWRQQFCASCH
jgi:hypothetical protein